jgi:hypothetical protein
MNHEQQSLIERRLLRVLLCGTQLDGTITPILVDEDGKIILST